MKMKDRQRTARILVLGDAGVGKTALIVRCLTRRFLPEYVTGYDSTHMYDTHIDQERVQLELVDSSRKNDLAVSLADAFVVVYSIINKESFSKIWEMMSYVKKVNTHNAPIAIVANKTDLVHARRVSRSEGAKAAKELKASLFCELSVANDICQVQTIFHELYKRVVRRKQKVALKLEKNKKMNKAVNMMRFIFSSNRNLSVFIGTNSVRAIKDSSKYKEDRRGSMLSRISL